MEKRGVEWQDVADTRTGGFIQRGGRETEQATRSDEEREGCKRFAKEQCESP